MLNNRVEKCPVCGKIKSKEKSCKSCGFDGGESGIKQEEQGSWTNALDLNEYFVSFVIERDGNVSFSNVTLSNSPTIRIDNISSIQNQIKDEFEADKITIINFIKL